ncbi:MAG: hypothetical protein RIS09_536 [Actinomycetota bacterium]|jgi:peptidoglycan/LPS O-acetylase OafA/YrhL
MSSALVVPMRRIVRATLALLVLAVLLGIVTMLFNQPVGIGILIGSAVSLLFFLVSALVALRTASSSPEKLAIWVLSSWLLKIVVLIAILAWLQNQEFYNRLSLFLSLVLTTIITLIADALITIKTRVPYVE